MNMTTFTSPLKRFRVALQLPLMLGLCASAHAAAPDANNDSFTSGANRVQADATKLISTATLLGNDSGDDIVFNALGGSSSTAGAPISVSGGIITYDPRNVASFINLPDGVTSDDTFTYSISGSDGPNNSATVTIRVEGVNNAPTFGSLPSSPLSMNDNATSRPFSSTTVNDPDTGEIVSITLDVNNGDHNDNKGRFAQTPGFSGSKSFSGPSGSGVYTLTNATIGQAQAALRDLTFTPEENYSIPGTIDDTVFSLTLTDGDLSDSGNNFTLNVKSKNDTPVLSNPGGTTTYNLGAGDQADLFSQVILADPDLDAVATTEGSDDGLFTATITLSSAGAGTLSGPSFATTTSTVYTLVGTREELVGSINSIEYIAPSANATFTITLNVTDPVSTDPAEGEAVSNDIVITAIVTQPEPGIVGLVATQSITDKNVTLPFATALFNNFGTDDRRVVVTVGSSSGVEGAFDVLAGFTNEGAGVYSFVGSSVEATNAIRALRFKPTSNRITGTNEAVSFKIEVKNAAGTAVLDSVDPAVTLTVTPVNDAPSISSPNSEIRIDDDAVGTKPFADVVLSDPDEGGNQPIFVTVTLVGEELDTGAPRNGGGNLATSTTPILGFTETTTSVFTYTFSGTPTQVNELLQNLVFTPNGDRNPEGQRETITFTILVEDTSDSSGLSAQNQGTTVIVLSVNGSPIIGEVPSLAQQPFPTPGSADAGGTYTTSPFEDLTLDDDDGGDLTFTITLDDAAKGTLIDSSSKFATTDGGLTYTMIGTTTEIETALQGLVYSLDQGFTFPLDSLGGTTFTLRATDGSSNTTTEVLAIVIRERNVAYIVTNTNDSGTGSLREAVGNAGNNDFIVFELPVDAYPATIHLQSALTIEKNMTVVGSGVDQLTISGDSDDDGVGDVSLFVVTDGADLTLEHLTLQLGNAPSYGGAVAAGEDSRIVVRFCSFEQNTAGQFGGAIDVLDGELLVESCLFLNNNVNELTAFAGGAISVTTTQASVVRNSTFVGNEQRNAGGDGGGAIYAENSVVSVGFDLLVEHCTFKGNSDAADSGTSILASTRNLEVTVRNNIFGDVQGSVLDVAGDPRFISQGGNIATNNPTGIFTDDPGDIALLDDSIDDVNALPMLLPLADNGGETMTCALDVGSPALDNAAIASPLAEQPAIDQRGVWRDAAPDSGAFESGVFKRITINEIFVNTDTGEEQFIEFYNPRDSEPLSINGLKLFVDGNSAGTIGGLLTFLPGAGEAWPSGAGLNLNKEKGSIELRNDDGQVLMLVDYISSFIDDAGDEVDMLSQSITRYPRYEGGLLPHERVYVLVNGTATGLTSTSPDQDVNGSPLDGGNAPPIAVNDLDENDDAIYNILASETITLDVLANDVEFDRTDTLKIEELMQLGGDPVTVIGGEFTNLLATNLELDAISSPGDILFPITPVDVATPLLFDPTDASLTIDAGDQSLTYDPTASPQVISLAKDDTLTDYWAYTILDYDASDDAQSRGVGTTIQENNIKRATAYFKVVITGINETPEPVDDSDPDLATTENRALRILADSDLLPLSFDFIDQEVDFQEFDDAGVQGPFLPLYPKYAILDNDDDVDTDDTNKSIRIIAVHTTATETDELVTTSELDATVTLDLRTERIETNILYDPRSSDILNALSKGETVTDSFYYSVVDKHGDRAHAKVSIIVTGVNDVPVATDDPGYATNEDKALVITAAELTDNDSDVDSDDTPVIEQPIIPATSLKMATLAFDGTSITYDPRTITGYESLARNETLEDSFTYTLIDNEGGSDVATVFITVEGRNDAPTAVDDFRDVTENDTATVGAPGVLLNDGDVDINGTPPDDDPWIIPQRGVTTSLLGASLNINPDGSYRYDANSVAIDALIEGEEKSEFFPYIITDNSRLRASDDTYKVFAVANLQTAPSDIVDYSEDSEDAERVIIQSANHQLSDGMLIQIQSHDGAGDYNGLHTVTVIDDDSFSIPVPYVSGEITTLGTWSPLVYTIPILLNDGIAGASPVAIESYGEDISDPTVIVIESENHSLRDGLYIKIEDYQGTGDYNGVYPITSVDRDHFSVAVPYADDPVGTRGTWVPWFAITDETAPDNGGTIEVVDGQTVLYTPVSGFAGEESFSYTIVDGVGGQDVATVTVEVIDPTQNALLVASPDRYRVGKGTTDVVVDVLTNDVTLPGNLGALSIESVVATGGALGSVALVDGDTALSYTPSTDTFTGTETFNYTISAGGIATSTSQVTFVVEDRMLDNTGNALLGQLSGNDDFFAIVSESTGNVLDVLANDPNLPNFPVTSTILSVTTPTSGTVTIDGSSLIYNAPTGIGSGGDSFEYTSVDASGATTTQIVTIQIVENVQTFIAQPDQYTVVAGSEMVLLPVLTNDRTVLDDTAVLRIEKLGLDGDAPPNVNRVAISANENFIEYTPPLTVPALGQEDFNYEISIGGTELDEAKITITVVDSLPVQTQAEDDFFTVARDSGAHVLNLVNNDLPYPLAGWTWTISNVSTPDNEGTVEIDGDSTVIYEAKTGFFGIETFTYDIVDAFGASSTATVTVEVGEQITAPDAYVVLANSTGNVFDVLANDDILGRYGEDYTITLVDGQTQSGAVSLSGGITPNNRVLYAPLAGYTGEEEFDYTITDKSGNTTQETVTVTIIAEDSDRAFATLEVKVTGKNDIPQLSGAADGAITDKETIQLFDTGSSEVLITDLDEFGAQLQSVTLTFDSTYGSIVASGMTMNGSGSYSIVDTPANVTAALRAIVFTPTENVIDYIDPGFYDLAFNLSIEDYDVGITTGVSDGPDSAVTGVTKVRITPIDDAPTIVSLIPDMLLQVNSLPRARQLAPHFADVDDDIAAGELVWTVSGNTNPGLFESVAIDASKQLVVLTFAADAFGEADITILATDRGSLTVDTTFKVTVEGPPVIELDVGETQPPAATFIAWPTVTEPYWLYRQSFRVTNEGQLEAEAFILHITELFSSVASISVKSGEYSTDENGTPQNFSDDTRASDGVAVLFQEAGYYTVKYDKPLQSGESIVVHVNYRFGSLDPAYIRPDIRVELTTATPEPIGSGIIAIPDPVTGEVELTFAVEAGKSYLIESSPDMLVWTPWAISTPVNDYDREITIIDDGLYTDPHPSQAPQRFYRLVEIVTP